FIFSEDSHCNVPLSSQLNEESQARVMKEFVSSSHVAETQMVGQISSFQPLHSMLPLDRSNYKQVLQGPEGILNCEGEESADGTNPEERGNIEEIN
ncbi:hypothetical protein U1Q18_007080, partial [Sarracenia purpurea var. burkii]